MIYPVKIINNKGKIKKVVSGDKLTDLHWKRFYDDENQIDLMHGPRNNNVPNHVKKKLDQRYAGVFDQSFSFIN